MTTVRLTNFEVAVMEAALQDYKAKFAKADPAAAARNLTTADAILKKLGPDMFR
jgi:hypothetical protein